MIDHAELMNFLQNIVDQPLLLALIIIGISFTIEDLATTSAALIASTTDIGLTIPLMALFTGIIVGDFGLYAIGNYAGHTRYAQKILAKPVGQKLQNLIKKNLFFAVFVPRFLPGVRAPAYIAIGASEVKFERYAMIVICAVGVWTGFIFTLFYHLGAAAESITGPLKWIVLGVLMLLYLLLPKLLHSFCKDPVKSKDQ